MALTANRDLDRYVDQELRTLPVKAGAHVYRGALVGLAGGFARGLVAGDAFVGVAYEEIDNTAGSDGDVMLRVFTSGDFEHALAGAVRANNGKPVYASDDATLTTTASGNSFVGHQLDVPSSEMMVLRIQATPTPLAGGTLTGELVSAGIQHKVTTKAGAAEVTLTAGDLGGLILVTGTVAGNLNLPPVADAGSGAWCTLIKTGATGVLTIEPAGAETINGQANNTDMDAAHDSITIVCDGSQWHIVTSQIS